MWTEINRTIERDEEGRPLFLDGIARDVTRRMHAEASLRESEKLAATGRVAAGIAHEINNPLAGIKNAFSLIKTAVPQDHPHFEYVGLIDKEIQRIAGVVRGMFDLYRPATDPIITFRIGETLNDVLLLLEPIRMEHGVELDAELEGEDETLYQPENLFRQILFNLVRNAIEAAETGSVVHIRVRVDTEDIRIGVEDSGPGVPAELAEQIFEPFFSTKTGSVESGLGLGLSVSRTIAQSLNGRLTLRHHRDPTCFEAVVPVKADSPMSEVS